MYHRLILTIIFVFTSSQLQAKDFPYSFSAKTDASIVAVSSALAIYSHVKMESNPLPTEQELAELTPSNLNSLDRPYAGQYDAKWQDISNYAQYVSIPTLTLGTSLAVDYEHSLELLAIAVESFAVSGALTQFAKASVRRFRPRAYPGSALPLASKLRKDQTNSFFSGHSSAISTSCAFTAKVFSDYYPDSDYRSAVWASMILIAGFGSWARVEAGAHFPTDAIVGFIVGLASGWAIPEIHKITNEKMDISQGQDGLSFNFEYRF